MLEKIIDAIASVLKNIESEWLVITFLTIVVIVIATKKSINKIITSAPELINKAKKENLEKELRESIRKEIREELKAEERGVTIEDLKDHDLFVELELQKKTVNKNFTTHGKFDENKTKIFKIFLEEKMNSVNWSMQKMLKEYHDLEKNILEKHSRKINAEDLKHHVLKNFIACDENLGCELDYKLNQIGLDAHTRKDIIDRFSTVRANTLKNYNNRINRMFTPSTAYHISNEFLILSLFEIIAFEIEGMVRDISAAFETINGMFLDLNLNFNNVY